jgi:hypothetical protein
MYNFNYTDCQTPLHGLYNFYYRQKANDGVQFKKVFIPHNQRSRLEVRAMTFSLQRQPVVISANYVGGKTTRILIVLVLKPCAPVPGVPSARG